jgi:hypothetical protein
MAEGTQTIDTIGVSLALDTSNFDSGLTKARSQLAAFESNRSRALSAPRSVTITPQFQVNQASVRALKIDMNDHLSKMAARNEAVAIPVKLGASDWAGMRSQISQKIGDVPIKVTLSGSLNGLRGQAKGLAGGAAGGTTDLLRVVEAFIAYSGNTSLTGASMQLRKATASKGVKNVPGMAHGGPVGGGQIRLVGEEGPEVVQFQRPAQVYRHGTQPANRGYGYKYGPVKPMQIIGTGPAQQAIIPSDPRYVYHGTEQMRRSGFYERDVRKGGVRPASEDWHNPGGPRVSFWSPEARVARGYGSYTLRTPRTHDMGGPYPRMGEYSGEYEEMTSRRPVRRDRLQYFGDDSDWHGFRRGRRRAEGGFARGVPTLATLADAERQSRGFGGPAKDGVQDNAPWVGLVGSILTPQVRKPVSAYGHIITPQDLNPVIRSYDAISQLAANNPTGLPQFGGKIWYQGRRRGLLEEAKALGDLDYTSFASLLKTARHAIDVPSVASPGMQDESVPRWAHRIMLGSRQDPGFIADIQSGKAGKEDIRNWLMADQRRTHISPGRGYDNLIKAMQVVAGTTTAEAALRTSPKVRPFRHAILGADQLVIDSHHIDAGGFPWFGMGKAPYYGSLTGLGTKGKFLEDRVGSEDISKRTGLPLPTYERAVALAASARVQPRYRDVWDEQRQWQAGVWTEHFPRGQRPQPYEAALTRLAVPRGGMGSIPPGWTAAPGSRILTPPGGWWHGTGKQPKAQPWRAFGGPAHLGKDQMYRQAVAPGYSIQFERGVFRGQPIRGRFSAQDMYDNGPSSRVTVRALDRNGFSVGEAPMDLMSGDEILRMGQRSATYEHEANPDRLYWHPVMTEVKKEHQGKKISNAMYHALEHLSGAQVAPGDVQLASGIALWGQPVEKRPFGHDFGNQLGASMGPRTAAIIERERARQAQFGYHAFVDGEYNPLSCAVCIEHRGHADHHPDIKPGSAMRAVPRQAPSIILPRTPREAMIPRDINQMHWNTRPDRRTLDDRVATMRGDNPDAFMYSRVPKGDRLANLISNDQTIHGKFWTDRASDVFTPDPNAEVPRNPTALLRLQRAAFDLAHNDRRRLSPFSYEGRGWFSHQGTVERDWLETLTRGAGWQPVDADIRNRRAFGGPAMAGRSGITRRDEPSVVGADLSPRVSLRVPLRFPNGDIIEGFEGTASDLRAMSEARGGQPVPHRVTEFAGPTGYRKTSAMLRRAFGGPAMSGTKFPAVDADAFAEAISAARAITRPDGRSIGETVYQYPTDEYRAMRTFLNKDRSAGYAIKDDGDSVSAFSTKGGWGKAIMRSILQRGGTKLDAFDEHEPGRINLPSFYSRFGFRETGRDPWNDDYAPEGWKGGKPDVVYMQRTPRKRRMFGGPANRGMPQGYSLRMLEGNQDRIGYIGGYHTDVDLNDDLTGRVITAVAVHDRSGEIAATQPISSMSGTDWHRGFPRTTRGSYKSPYAEYEGGADPHETYWHPHYTYTNEDHRKKGVASSMYAEIERLTGIMLSPASTQLRNGTALWNMNDRPFGAHFGRQLWNQYPPERDANGVMRNNWHPQTAPIGWDESRSGLLTPAAAHGQPRPRSMDLRPIEDLDRYAANGHGYSPLLLRLATVGGAMGRLEAEGRGHDPGYLGYNDPDYVDNTTARQIYDMRRRESLYTVKHFDRVQQLLDMRNSIPPGTRWTPDHNSILNESRHGTGFFGGLDPARLALIRTTPVGFFERSGAEMLDGYNDGGVRRPFMPSFLRNTGPIDLDNARALTMGNRFVNLARLPHRASGGGASQQTYLVGELAPELFVPNRSLGIVPADVMDKIPKRAQGGETRKMGAGVIEIGSHGPHLFTPPEDGWIIPHNLVGQVTPNIPRAAGGTRKAYNPKNIPQPDSLINMESLEQRIQHEREDAAAVHELLIGANLPVRGSTPKAVLGNILASKGRQNLMVRTFRAQQLATQHARMVASSAKDIEYGRALEESPQYAAAMRSRDETVAGVKTGFVGPITSDMRPANVRKHQERIAREGATAYQAKAPVLFASGEKALTAYNARVTSATEALAKWEKPIRAGKALAEENNKQFLEAAKAAEQATPGLKDMARAGISTFTGFTLYGVAQQAVTLAMSAIVPAAESVADTMLGFKAANTRVTKMIGSQIVAAGGNMLKAFGEVAQAAGLGAESMTYLKDSLGSSSMAKAGQQVEAQGADLWRGSMMVGGKAPTGLYGGYGGINNSGAFAQMMGGSAGFAETVGGNFAAGNTAFNINKSKLSSQVPSAADAVGGYPTGANPIDWSVDFVKKVWSAGPFGDSNWLYGQAVPAIGGANGGYEDTNVSHPLLTSEGRDAYQQNQQVVAGQKEYAAHLTDLMQRSVRFDAQPGTAFSVKGGYGRSTDTRSKDQQAAVDKFKAAAEATKDPDAIAAAQNMINAGYVMLDASGKVADSADDFQKGMEQAAKGATITDPVVYMAQQARSILAQGAAQKEMSAYQTQRVESSYGEQLQAQPFLNAGVGISTKTLSGGTRRDVKSSIAEANAAQRALTEAGDAAVDAQTKWIRSLEAGDPTLAGTADAYAGFMSEVKDSGKEIAKFQTSVAKIQLGVAESQFSNNMRLASRAVSDALGLAGRASGPNNLGAVQREQTMLGFGLQQKQINFSVAMAGFQAPGLTSEERAARRDEAKIEAKYAQKQLNLSKQAFGIQAGRGVTDTTAARRILKEEWDAQQRVAAITKQIAAEQAKQSKAIAKAGIEVQKAEGTFGNRVSAASQYVSVFGGTIKGATDALRKALGMEAVNWDGTKGNKKANRGTSRGAQATGYVGSVQGATEMTVGEAGTEHVAVLRNPRTMMANYASLGGQGGGGPVTVNLNLTVQGDVKDDATVAKIVRAVEDTFNRKAARLGMRTFASSTG